VIGEDHQVVAAAARQLRHPPDLRDSRISAAQVGERLLARWPEVMRELVVLHERAVDDRHAEVHVEQDRHRSRSRTTTLLRIRMNGKIPSA
jgi:hypothetical protein